MQPCTHASVPSGAHILCRRMHRMLSSMHKAGHICPLVEAGRPERKRQWLDSVDIHMELLPDATCQSQHVAL